jgi:glutamate decarboxylase
MSLDLLDRLIADIFDTTQTLMNSDLSDLQAWGSTAVVERTHGRVGHDGHNKPTAARPLHRGIHRSVC